MPTAVIALRRDNVSCHVSTGGGGFGSPVDRAARSVLEKVLNGNVSVVAARELYGTVLSVDPPSVEAVSTAALRLSPGTQQSTESQ